MWRHGIGVGLDQCEWAITFCLVSLADKVTGMFTVKFAEELKGHLQIKREEKINYVYSSFVIYIQSDLYCLTKK